MPDPRVVPYDPAWVDQFVAARAQLRQALGALLVADVEHVGSTSVPGLAAKPVIDMVAGVASLDSARATDGALAALGYAVVPHRPEARLFVRRDPRTGHDTDHLHLTVPGSDLWVERLTFRDALRADAALAGRYAAWKHDHATGDPAGAYDARKTPFVTEVLAGRGVILAPDDVRLRRARHIPLS